MATIALSLDQAGGTTQVIPFSVKLSDFVLVEPDPVNNPGKGEYKVTILPSVGSKYVIMKMVMKTSDDLISQNMNVTINAVCPSNTLKSSFGGVRAGSTQLSIASLTDPNGIGFALLDGELSLKNGDTFGNDPITSLVDATLSGYIEITKEV